MSEAEVLPESRRPDGSIRPAVRVKKGYVPPEEQQKFADYKPTGPVEIPGADPSDAPKPKSKTAAKNEKRKQAKKAEMNKEVDKVAELAAAMGVTPPPPVVASSAPAAAPVTADAPPPADGAAAAPPSAAPAAREAAPAATDAAEPNEVEKKVRALKKKLRAADDLVAKQASGSELNADQLAKVAARAEIEAEIARWEALKDVDELVKEVKKLGKKMRQIEELEERAAKGESLNADQPGKIQQKDKVAAEYTKLNELKDSITGKS